MLPLSFTMLVTSTEAISLRVLEQRTAFEGMHLELIQGAGCDSPASPAS